MVKNVILFFIVISLFTSCCDYKGLSNAGRSKYKYKKYLKKRINPENINIRTDVVYKYIYYSYSELDNKYSYLNDSISLSIDTYFHFHTNGTYFSFIYRTNNKELNNKSFNPRAGELGFVIKKRNQNYLMDYGSMNCGLFSKVDFEIKGDTLILKRGDTEGYRVWYYYVEKKVPKEWLNYKPDI